MNPSVAMLNTNVGIETMAHPLQAASVAGLLARVAVYDTLAAAPRIEEVSATDEVGFIEALSSGVYSIARDAGGSVPYTVVREVVENLIHADFREIVVSVLDSGSSLRFSDQGPGIADKDRALLPGFTTATAQAKQFIRGVGSGLPIVNEYLEHCGGSLSIEDNLGGGTVVTMSFHSPPTTHAPSEVVVEPVRAESAFPALSLRQKKVLSLVLEFEEAGPTLVSKELSVGLSTAYRDLAFLEEHSLIRANDLGRRVITESGVAYLDALFD
jgi:hypothetical protein